MELIITGEPREVAPAIAQANSRGYKVDVQPIGSGLVQVTVRQDTWAAAGVPQQRPAAGVPDVARPVLPRVLWVAGGTGTVAMVGGTITLAVTNPAMLAIASVMTVLVLIGLGSAVSSVRSVYKGD